MIRPIQQKDREIYLEMAEEFYKTDAVYMDIPKENLEKGFSELMRSKDRIEAFIIEAGGDTAGYVLLAKFFSQEAGGETIWFDEIYVRDNFRGKGLGSSAMQEIMEKFKECSFRLEIEPDNDGAVRLYERLGFQHLPYGEMYKFKKTD